MTKNCNIFRQVSRMPFKSFYAANIIFFHLLCQVVCSPASNVRNNQQQLAKGHTFFHYYVAKEGPTKTTNYGEYVTKAPAAPTLIPYPIRPHSTPSREGEGHYVTATAPPYPTKQTAAAEAFPCPPAPCPCTPPEGVYQPWPKCLFPATSPPPAPPQVTTDDANPYAVGPATNLPRTNDAIPAQNVGPIFSLLLLAMSATFFSISLVPMASISL